MTLVPLNVGGWWIAKAYDGDPAVWAPGPFAGHPIRILRRRQVMAPLWDQLAALLPDRGDCTACTAVPCAAHTTTPDTSYLSPVLAAAQAELQELVTGVCSRVERDLGVGVGAPEAFTDAGYEQVVTEHLAWLHATRRLVTAIARHQTPEGASHGSR